MSYGQWKIDDDLTFKEFGYYSTNLTFGSNKPIKCVCESCGEVRNKILKHSNRKHVCKSIIDGKKKCFKCKNIKVIEEFSKNRSTFDGYQKVCKECFSNYDSVKMGYKRKSERRKFDLKSYFQNKTSYLKNKCILKNLDFDLDNNFLYNLYLKQKGKCHYLNVDIISNTYKCEFNSISVDRLDPTKGYVKENVVLSSFSINSFKGSMSENEFKTFLKSILPNLIEYSIK